MTARIPESLGVDSKSMSDRRIRVTTTLRNGRSQRFRVRSMPIGVSEPLVFVLLLAMILDPWLLRSEGFATSSSFPSSSPSSSSPEPSPWASSSWLLELDFGQPKKNSNSIEEPPSTLFSDSSPFASYGNSGSRLVVTCPVVVEAEDDANNKKSPDAFIGRGASVIRARNANDDDNDGGDDVRKKTQYFTYSSMEGQRSMEFSPGGWTLRFPPGGTANRGRASKLRFYFDLTIDLKRNDVLLPAGTRLYFAASAWREVDYEKGLAKVRPLQIALEEAQGILDERLSHETGDRRLDGTDPIETLKAYKDMTALVLDRDRKRMALREALDQDGHGYPGSDDHPEGPWPGTTEWLTLSESNPIYARVPKKAIPKNKNEEKDGGRNLLQQLMGSENDYHYGRVGTWNGEAISSLLLDDGDE